MYCPECGKKILDDSVFCPECGKKIKKPDALQKSINDTEDKADNTKSYYKWIVACAVIILIAAATLPIYYFESSSYHISVKFLGGSSAIRTYFGIAWGVPMIRYNTAAFIGLLICSLLGISFGIKKNPKYIPHCFWLSLCILITHLIVQIATLPSMGMVSFGFFVIAIASVVGIVCSNKCKAPTESEDKQ